MNNKVFKKILRCSYSKLPDELSIDIIKILLKNKEYTKFAPLIAKKYNLKGESLAHLASIIQLAEKLKTDAITDISLELESNNLEVVLLKSSSLNNDTYEEKYPRGSSDIDILVKEENLEKVTSVLSKHYEKVIPASYKPFEEYYESTWRHKVNKQVFLDVHTAICNPLLFQIDIDEIFTKSKAHPHYKSNSLLKMTDEHMLVSLAVHMFKDGVFYHHSLLDFAELASRANKEIVMILAKNWGCKLLLKTTYEYVEDVFGNVQTLRTKILNKLMINHVYKKGTIRKRIQQITLTFLMSDRKKDALCYITQFIKKFMTSKFSLIKQKD